MIRFRNPGTQFSTQVQVIKELYNELGAQKSFTLQDMAFVIAKSNLMTAYGYAGDEALRLSNTDQESMNSALMNSKMYAEVFRMLGWVTPYSEESSYPLVFTYIGIHVALSNGDCSRIYEQCVLGINNPTELTAHMTYTEKVRFFKCVLRTFIDLGGTMYKHELCLGPMSVDDIDENAYQQMIRKINGIRGNYNRLKNAFSELADSLNMKTTPVDNCTRLPIGFMKSCGLVESIITRELYGRSMQCLRITDHGRDVYNYIAGMKDLRIDEFNTFDTPTKHALIRLGVYGMLERSGYNMESVREVITEDTELCADILQGRELLFSPCQTIKRKMVEEALGIEIGADSDEETTMHTFTGLISERQATVINTWALDIAEDVDMGMLNLTEDIAFVNQVNDLVAAGRDSHQIVDYLFDYYISATQTVFYPLIATLFKIIGFNCSFSRPGDNGARWDAIIIDPERSIPIEIKSPTEELHLSVKAIRQALENKIILLSRRTHNTTVDITSLAVGYYLPNDRAEVGSLISAFKNTYGYKIGVIDLKSLLSLSISKLVDGRGFNKELLFSLEGFVNANI